MAKFTIAQATAMLNSYVNLKGFEHLTTERGCIYNTSTVGVSGTGLVTGNTWGSPNYPNVPAFEQQVALMRNNLVTFMVSGNYTGPSSFSGSLSGCGNGIDNYTNVWLSYNSGLQSGIRTAGTVDTTLNSFTTLGSAILASLINF